MITEIRKGYVRQFQVSKNEPEENYPKDDCGPGSLMEIIDTATKEVVGYKVFDGTNWNDL